MGGVLTGPEIERRIEIGEIEIDPYDPKHVGPNSLDMHLESLYQYEEPVLSASIKHTLMPTLATQDGWFISPGRVYIGCTRERICAHTATWRLDLRSSAGRLGLAHLAGIGDHGFDGKITVELTAAQPVWVGFGARLFQITFFDLVGQLRPYVGRYQNATGAEASKFSEKP